MACLYRSLRFGEEYLPVSACWWIKPDITYPWLLLGFVFYGAIAAQASDIEAEGTQIDHVAHGRHAANA